MPADPRRGCDAQELMFAPPVDPLNGPLELQQCLDLLTQYVEHAVTFERMADAESIRGLKGDLERKAMAYRRPRKLG
jgi:hypothetical protein